MLLRQTSDDKQLSVCSEWLSLVLSESSERAVYQHQLFVSLNVMRSLTSVERYFVLCKLLKCKRVNKRNLLFGFVFVLGSINW